MSILDGFHRAAIMAAAGEKLVRVAVLAPSRKRLPKVIAGDLKNGLHRKVQFLSVSIGMLRRPPREFRNQHVEVQDIRELVSPFLLRFFSWRLGYVLQMTRRGLVLAGKKNRNERPPVRVLEETLQESADKFILAETTSGTPQLLREIGEKLSILTRLKDARNTTQLLSVRCFLIWGHGTDQLDEIEAVVAQSLMIEQVSVQKIDDLNGFVELIYAEELLTKSVHIRNKTAYLASVPNRVGIFVIKDQDGPFTCDGHGPQKAVCRNLIEHAKQTVRDMFNPRDIAGHRTEDHVIHGTNADNDTMIILQHFGIPTTPWKL